ncbi:hypothetical protein Chor_012698 [Crotalus horridus]
MLHFPWGVAVFLPFLLGQTPDPHDPCYNANQRPQYCLPELSELASGRLVEASSTCSSPPGRFCTFQDSTNPASKFCQGCQEHTHQSEQLTDSDGDTTCWWSQPTANATLTLALGRQMEILYVALRHCWQRYHLPPTTSIVKSMEHETVCIEAQTALKPLTGGLVAFMLLAGHPSSQRFEYSPVLQDWVTTTHLCMSFDRMHSAWTLGLHRKEASYGVAELQVGGRWKCNGHASRCTAGKDEGVPQCDCRDNTAGPECDICKTFYWDRPWQRATPKDAHECVGETVGKIGHPWLRTLCVQNWDLLFGILLK